MKTRLVFPLLILLNLPFLFLKAEQVPLNLKTNDELIFDWTEKVYYTKDDHSMIESLHQIRYSILITKIEKDAIYLEAKILSDKTRDFRDNIFVSFLNRVIDFDCAFPPLVRSFNETTFPGFSNEIVYPLTFQIKLNTLDQTCQLLNRIELLEQCNLTFEKKGYSEEIRSKTITQINGNELPKRISLFLFPFCYKKVGTQNDSITIRDYNCNFKLDYPGHGKKLEITGFSNSSKDTIRRFHFELNKQSGYLKHFSDDVRTKVPKFHKLLLYDLDFDQMHFSNELSLVSYNQKKPETLTVSGHINNPVGPQMILYTLDKAFGEELKTKAVFLDEHGNFNIKTWFKHKGLVYLTNLNKNQSVSSPIFLLYAEPGDSIYFQSKLVQKEYLKYSTTKKDSIDRATNKYIVPEDIVFSGDRKPESELLYQLQHMLGLNPLEQHRGNLYLHTIEVNAITYIEALRKLNSIIATSPGNIEKDQLQCIANEYRALLLCDLFYAGKYRNAKELFFFNSLWYDEKSEPIIKNTLDTININNIYNDYGFFSRRMAKIYTQYKLHVWDKPIAYVGTFSTSDLEKDLQTLKLVLSGSALYRESARYIYEVILSNRRFGEAKVWDELAESTIDLMIRRSNDPDFIQAMEDLQQATINWSDDIYLPSTIFLNLKNKPLRLSQFVRSKPTVIYSSSDWSVGRYEMDEQAGKNPEINFVLINDGSNFQSWKEWNDRAEPVAQQLFLPNDSLQLEDVFARNFRKYLVYDISGKIIGSTDDPYKAAKIAKQSLNSPKEKQLNKSQLLGIIWFLTGSVVLFLIVFLLYKYRMKQRLKKQAQEKRLKELQLAAIRAQMNPHFLFNSLNSVQNLIQQNRAEEAHLYLSDFAGLIRKVLKNSDKEEVSLAEELETLTQYLQLEKLRFDFDYTISVDGNIDQDNFMVPSLILQPIAENAILHGLQHKPDNKKLWVEVKKTGDMVVIAIEDNGIGIKAAKELRTSSNGVGIRMNEERLKILDEKYGGKYSFRMIDLTDLGKQGTRVEISIPDEL